METTGEQPTDIANPRLTDAQIEVLRKYATKRHLRDGENLFTAGGREGGFYIVQSGEVEVYNITRDQERSVARHHAHEFTGDIDIMSRRRSLVSARAHGETEVLHVPSGDIRRIVGSDPGLGEVILRAFIGRREALFASDFEGIRVLGSGRARETFQIREFLTRNRVPFSWIDLDADNGVAKLLEHFSIDFEDTPVVACSTDSLLRNPTIEDLAEAIGLPRPMHEDTYDFVIIGGGPAGLAAAVYSASEGLSTLVLDRHAPGGQAGTASKIENYLGFPTGITGSELTSRALLQAQKFGALISTPAEVVSLAVDQPQPTIQIASGEKIKARAVLIASGAEYRKLDVPGRSKLDSLGVYYAATHIELLACLGADVVVVGGGNSAGQATMFLAENTRKVYVLLRGDDIYKRMSSYLVDRILERPNVEVHYNTEIREMHGEDRLESIVTENTKTGERQVIATPAVFTFIGASPRTDWLPSDIECDSKGFILTGDTAHLESSPDSILETSVPGIYAAGDVRYGSTKRVASAVGEGAMVVKFVHKHLASLPA